MKPRGLIIGSSIYGLILGFSISTRQLTAEVFIKGLLAICPPVAIAFFIKDTQHHTLQNQVKKELKEIKGDREKIAKRCAYMAQNEGNLYLKIISVKEELIHSREETVVLQEKLYRYKNRREYRKQTPKVKVLRSGVSL